LISEKSFPATDLWYKAVIPGAWGLTVCMTMIYQFISFRDKNLHAQRIQAGIRKRNRLAGDKDREFSLPVNIQGSETSASAYDIIYLQHAGQQTIIGFRKNTGEVLEGLCSRNFKSVRESMRKLSNFYRCHRDWVVNTDKVTGVIADANGFLLQTEKKGLLIPVSSSLNDDLDDRLMK
jgi:DNA-binding LytR/AlgR family response regulator